MSKLAFRAQKADEILYQAKELKKKKRE